MFKSISFILINFVFAIQAKTHIDVTELRCLVCRTALDELDVKIKEIDPDRKIEIGGYRIDSEGNLKRKSVSEAKSEIHLSELADSVCDKMDDYVRATWKDSGKLTIMKLIESNGQMNANLASVDIIQDDDLNKSLKYYCEGIIEEHEESIIKHFINDTEDIKFTVCTQEAQFCSASDSEQEELIQHSIDEL